MYRTIPVSIAIVCANFLQTPPTPRLHSFAVWIDENKIVMKLYLNPGKNGGNKTL